MRPMRGRLAHARAPLQELRVLPLRRGVRVKAGDLTARHRGQHVVIRMGRDRVAGPLAGVAHLESGTQVTVQTGVKGGKGWQSCCLDHDTDIELKEKK